MGKGQAHGVARIRLGSSESKDKGHNDDDDAREKEEEDACP